MGSPKYSRWDVLIRPHHRFRRMGVHPKTKCMLPLLRLSDGHPSLIPCTEGNLSTRLRILPPRPRDIQHWPERIRTRNRLAIPPHRHHRRGDNNNYTTSPIDAATKQANRQSLGRKRKPVPAYDPNHDPSSPVPPTAFHAPPVPSPSLYSSDPSPSPEPSTVNQSANGGGGAHYATRSQLGQDQSVPDLTHKSSFGPGGAEGPLHYLIPDMPMPLRR
jgi:hypothetical protein